MLKTLSINNQPVADCVTYKDGCQEPKYQTGLYKSVVSALELGIPVLDQVKTPIFKGG